MSPSGSHEHVSKTRGTCKTVETSPVTSKTTIWCFYFLLTRLAKFLKTRKIQCHWGCEEKNTLIHCPWNVNGLRFWVGQLEALIKSSNANPSTATPQGYMDKMLTQMFTVAETCKQPKDSSIRKWLNQSQRIRTMEYRAQHLKRTRQSSLSATELMVSEKCKLS